MNTQTFFSKSIVFLLVFGVFLSCTDRINPEITEYQAIKLLEPEKVVQVPNTGYTFSFIVDSFLVFSPFFDSLYFHVFDKNNLEFLFKFGKKGRAHHEFGFPLPFNNQSRPDIHSVYSIYDLHLNQIKHIDFGAIAKGVNISEAIAADIMPFELVSTHELNYLSNGNVIGVPMPAGQKAQGLFFIYDPVSKKKQWAPLRNTYIMEERYEQDAYRGVLYSNAEHIFFASVYFDQVFFFNSRGDLLKEWYFSEIKMPLLLDPNTGFVIENPHFFRYIFGNSKSCFILRVGTLLPEWENNYIPVELFEFDWNGNLLNVFEIYSEIMGLSIDEESNTLYCVLKNKEESEFSTIAKFKLQ